MIRFSIAVLVVAFGALGCSSSDGGGEVVATSQAEAVDLNAVITAFEATLKAKNPNAKAKAPADPKAAAASAASAASVASAAPASKPEPVEDAAQTQMFVKTFRTNLNSARVDGSNQVGVFIRGDGAIEGFRDANKNDVKDTGERQLFWLEVDSERNRVIATQTIGGENYRRPHSYRSGGMMHGMLGGYILGRMMGRQRGYYSRAGRTRPRYGSQRMSPRGYRRGAVQKARAKVRTSSGGARSRGGSRGFRGGK